MKRKIRPDPKLLLRRRRKAVRRARRQQKRYQRQASRHAKHLLRLADGSPHPAIELAAPRLFTLQPSGRSSLVKFLRELVRITLVDERVAFIDFRGTEKFVSDGTVLFCAELQRILERRPGSVKCLPPKDPVARQVLAHLKLLSQMGYHKPIPSERDDVIHWQVFRGTQADATKGVGEAIDSLPNLPRAQIAKLFKSVTEALTNVTQHAYMKPRQDGTGLSTERGWWMFVRQEPDELTVSFCDLGVGVPYTVPELQKHDRWLAARLKSLLRAAGVHTHQEGEIIQATVDEKRSRFKLQHRGNGFANMVEAITAAGTGKMHIISNRGAYTFEKLAGHEDARAFNFHDSIYGTVIGWHITLPKEAA